MPIRAIADLVHAGGAKLCVDGVAYAPHRAIDVQALDADYYLFSFYKTYGPHAVMLYGRYELCSSSTASTTTSTARRKFRETRAGKSVLRAGLGRCRHRRLRRGARRRGGARGRRGVLCGRDRARDRARRAAARLAAAAQRRAHRRGSVRRTSVRVPTISFTVDGIDPAGDRRARRCRQGGDTPRRLPLAPPGGGARPRAERRHASVDGALQHARGGRPADRGVRRGLALTPVSELPRPCRCRLQFGGSLGSFDPKWVSAARSQCASDNVPLCSRLDPFTSPTSWVAMLNPSKFQAAGSLRRAPGPVTVPAERGAPSIRISNGSGRTAVSSEHKNYLRRGLGTW